MRKKRLVIVGVILLSFCWICCQAADKKKTKVETLVSANSWCAPDDSIVSKLGIRLTDVLFSPDKVRCYRVTPVDSVGKDDVVLEPNYIRDTLITTLNKEQISIIKFCLISNKWNYCDNPLHKDEVANEVMSPYMPFIEFEFTRKKEVAHVLISFSNFSWAIKYDGKTQLRRHYNSLSEIERFCNYLINNKENNK